MRLTDSQLLTLAAMLQYCRPHGSGGDHLFRADYLHTLPGITEDVHGNLILRIGEAPILWSSHTDTVHRVSGWQTVRVNPNVSTIRLSRKSKRVSSCLGADDTVGVFLMREMILRGVEGLYIFHYGEESGGIGSSSLAWDTPEMLDGIQCAIALDRAGTADIITHQIADRCCSDVFARSLALQLPGHYAPARGVYTDTAEYTSIIPECTNLSVGYYRQHSTEEYVDYAHVGRLLAALTVLDSSLLTIARDPHAPIPVSTFWGDTRWAGISRVSKRGNRVAGTDDDWCFYCDAPIYDDNDPRLYLSKDRCVCAPDDTFSGLSEDDEKFLRYLRER